MKKYYWLLQQLQQLQAAHRVKILRIRDEKRKLVLIV